MFVAFGTQCGLPLGTQCGLQSVASVPASVPGVRSASVESVCTVVVSCLVRRKVKEKMMKPKVEKSNGCRIVLKLVSRAIARGGRLIVSKLQSVTMCGDGCCFLIGETDSCRCSGRTGRVHVEAVGGSRSPGSNTIVVMEEGEVLEVVGSASR